MPRGYLDEMVPVNSGILGQYISPVGPFSEPMYAMVDNDAVVATPAPTRNRSNKSRKKKTKPKNDSIIRNHDSVWDYKIQDGKLLTRRKSSDGKWYDITSNEEARSKIESFTGRSIGTKSKKEQQIPSDATTPSTQSTDTTQVSNTTRTNQVVSDYTQRPGYNQNLDRLYNAAVLQYQGAIPSMAPVVNLDSLVNVAKDNRGRQQSSQNDNLTRLYNIATTAYGRPIIAANVPSLEDMLYGGAEFPNKRRSLKTTKSSNGAKTSSDIGKEFIAKNIRTAPIATNFLNRNIGDAIPLLGSSVYDQIWSNKIPVGPYLDIMQMLGINPMQDRINRYYPMI